MHVDGPILELAASQRVPLNVQSSMVHDMYRKHEADSAALVLACACCAARCGLCPLPHALGWVGLGWVAAGGRKPRAVARQTAERSGRAAGERKRRVDLVARLARTIYADAWWETWDGASTERAPSWGGGTRTPVTESERAKGVPIVATASSDAARPRARPSVRRRPHGRAKGQARRGPAGTWRALTWPNRVSPCPTRPRDRG
nr:unnamed protein product [Digitaria exilis]